MGFGETAKCNIRLKFADGLIRKEIANQLGTTYLVILITKLE